MTKPELNTGLARDQVTPLFYQLVNVLRDSVKEMEDGSRFSTERELSLQYGVSRGTVVRAINQLVDEGYLYRIQGKGTFVRQKIVPSKSHNILIILPKPIREYIVQKNYIM
ncbi:MAG: GntR family transcriptional regulator, partial [Armatimonadota bacterium]